MGKRERLLGERPGGRLRDNKVLTYIYIAMAFTSLNCAACQPLPTAPHPPRVASQPTSMTSAHRKGGQDKDKLGKNWKRSRGVSVRMTKPFDLN